jgi:hypothetical protein
MPLSLVAQSKLGMENYYYTGLPGNSSVVPMVHLETKRSFRGELRYNYEDARTFSLFAGKTIGGGKALEYHISPMIGFSTGLFRGISVAVNTEMEWKGLYLTSQNQLSMSTRNDKGSFIFSWSELGYNISDHFFGGIAMQYTIANGGNKAEPGFLAGFCLDKITIPFYAFSPFDHERYFVAGLIIECDLKKKNR